MDYLGDCFLSLFRYFGSFRLFRNCHFWCFWCFLFYVFYGIFSLLLWLNFLSHCLYFRLFRLCLGFYGLNLLCFFRLFKYYWSILNRCLFRYFFFWTLNNWLNYHYFLFYYWCLWLDSYFWSYFWCFCYFGRFRLLGLSVLLYLRCTICSLVLFGSRHFLYRWLLFWLNWDWWKRCFLELGTWEYKYNVFNGLHLV